MMFVLENRFCLNFQLKTCETSSRSNLRAADMDMTELKDLELTFQRHQQNLAEIKSKLAAVAGRAKKKRDFKTVRRF